MLPPPQLMHLGVLCKFLDWWAHDRKAPSASSQLECSPWPSRHRVSTQEISDERPTAAGGKDKKGWIIRRPLRGRRPEVVFRSVALIAGFEFDSTPASPVPLRPPALRNTSPLRPSTPQPFALCTPSPTLPGPNSRPRQLRRIVGYTVVYFAPKASPTPPGPQGPQSPPRHVHPRQLGRKVRHTGVQFAPKASRKVGHTGVQFAPKASPTPQGPQRPPRRVQFNSGPKQAQPLELGHIVGYTVV